MPLQPFAALLAFSAIICHARANQDRGLRVPRQIELDASFEEQADRTKELQDEYRLVYVSVMRFLESLNSSFSDMKSRLAVVETAVIQLNKTSSTCSCPGPMGPPGIDGRDGSPRLKGAPGYNGERGLPGLPGLPHRRSCVPRTSTPRNATEPNESEGISSTAAAVNTSTLSECSFFRNASRNLTSNEFENLLQNVSQVESGITFIGGTPSQISPRIGTSHSLTAKGFDGIPKIAVNHMDSCLADVEMHDPGKTLFNPVPMVIEANTKELFSFDDSRGIYPGAAFSYRVADTDVRLAVYARVGHAENAGNGSAGKGIGLAFVPNEYLIEPYYKTEDKRNCGPYVLLDIGSEGSVVTSMNDLHARATISNGTKAILRVEILKVRPGHPKIRENAKRSELEGIPGSRGSESEELSLAIAHTVALAQIQCSSLQPGSQNWTLVEFEKLLPKISQVAIGVTYNGSTVSEISSRIRTTYSLTVEIVNYMDSSLEDVQMHDPDRSIFNPIPAVIGSNTREVFSFYQPSCCWPGAAFSYRMAESDIRLAMYARVARARNAGIDLRQTGFGLAFMPANHLIQPYYIIEDKTLWGPFVLMPSSVQGRRSIVSSMNGLHARATIIWNNYKVLLAIEVIKAAAPSPASTFPLNTTTTPLLPIPGSEVLQQYQGITTRDFEILLQLQSPVDMGTSFNGFYASETSKLSKAYQSVTVEISNFLNGSLTNMELYQKREFMYNPAPTVIPGNTKEVFSFSKCDNDGWLMRAAISYYMPDTQMRLVVYLTTGLDLSGNHSAHTAMGLAFLPESLSMETYYYEQKQKYGPFLEFDRYKSGERRSIVASLGDLHVRATRKNENHGILRVEILKANKAVGSLPGLPEPQCMSSGCIEYLSKDQFESRAAKLTPNLGQTFNGSTLSQIISAVRGSGSAVIIEIVNHMTHPLSSLNMDTKYPVYWMAPSNIPPVSIPGNTAEVISYRTAIPVISYVTFSYEVESIGKRIALYVYLGWDNIGVGLQFLNLNTTEEWHSDWKGKNNGVYVEQKKGHRNLSVLSGSCNVYAMATSRYSRIWVIKLEVLEVTNCSAAANQLE